MSDHDTHAYRAYGQPIILERHRHHYEVSNAYRDSLARAGMVWSGVSPSKTLVEIGELRDHPWMVGSQFHPEFRSRPLEPHPLFVDFVRASVEYVPPKKG